MMCEATVYLNGEVIMRDVLMVEPIPEGVRLIALFARCRWWRLPFAKLI